MIHRGRPALLVIALLAGLAVTAVPSSAQQPPTRKLILTEPTLLDGVMCEERALFHASGRLYECRLAAGAEFLGNRFPPGSWVGYNPSGRPFVWLGQNTGIRGVECLGKGWRKWSTTLYADGVLRGCYLAAPAVVDGVPCRKASFLTEVLRGDSFLQLHHNGRLAECVASRAFTLDGATYRQGERVRLDAAGRALEDVGTAASLSG